MQFLTPRLSAESSDISFQKLFSPPVLAAILKLCIKCKNAFILETVRDRVNFSENFDFQGIQCQLAIFAKNHFLIAIFADRLIFCINGKKYMKQRKIVISTKSLMLIWTLYAFISFSAFKAILW